VDSSSEHQPPHERQGTPSGFQYDGRYAGLAVVDLPSVVGIIYPAITYDAVADRPCDEPTIVPIKPPREQV